MAIVSIQYSLPEEEDSLKLALRGREYYSFIIDLREEIRSWLRYECPYETVEEVLEYLYRKINEESQTDDIK